MCLLLFNFYEGHRNSIYSSEIVLNLVSSVRLLVKQFIKISRCCCELIITKNENCVRLSSPNSGNMLCTSVVCIHPNVTLKMCVTDILKLKFVYFRSARLKTTVHSLDIHCVVLPTT